MTLGTSSIPFLWSQETEPPTHQLLPSLNLLRAEERLVSPMGTRKSLCSHLLETPWQQSSLGIASERTHTLALEIGRPCITKGPLAGPSASTAHRGCFTMAVIPFLLPAPCPGSTLQLAPCWPAVTIKHLTFRLVAPSLAWRRKRKETVLGRRRKGSFGLFYGPLWFYVVFLSPSPSLPHSCTFGNMTGALPKLAGTPNSAILLRVVPAPLPAEGLSSPGGCLLRPSVARKHNPRSPGVSHWESQRRFLISPSSPCCCSLVISMVNIYYFQRNPIFYRENMFEVRCFHLGKGEGLFLE